MARRPLRTVPLFEWMLDQPTVKKLWSAEPHPMGEVVVEVLESLPEPYRSILEMRYWERLTFREIADRIGKNSRGSGKYHVGKAEREFKRAFIEQAEHHEG